MTLIPLNGYLVIEQTEVEVKTKGGIYLPEATREAEKNSKSEGIVVFTGRDSDVKVGDKVVFKKWSGDEFKFEGRNLLFVPEDDLVALLEAS